MSDEATSKATKSGDEIQPTDEWTMPEPVFRSSEGVSPKGMPEAETDKIGLEDDIPTEMMGFVDSEETSADAVKQSVRVKEKGRRRHHKKKRTQSKLMRGLALVIGLAIGGVILAVIYFLFR